MTPLQYKGFTIQEDYPNPYANKPELMFYPTAQGVQHDGDFDGESFKYCGNCKWTDCIEDAMAQIDEITDELLELCENQELIKNTIG